MPSNIYHWTAKNKEYLLSSATSKYHNKSTSYTNKSIGCYDKIAMFQIGSPACISTFTAYIYNSNAYYKQTTACSNQNTTYILFCAVIRVIRQCRHFVHKFHATSVLYSQHCTIDNLMIKKISGCLLDFWYCVKLLMKSTYSNFGNEIYQCYFNKQLSKLLRQHSTCDV